MASRCLPVTCIIACRLWSCCPTYLFIHLSFPRAFRCIPALLIKVHIGRVQELIVGKLLGTWWVHTRVCYHSRVRWLLPTCSWVPEFYEQHHNHRGIHLPNQIYVPFILSSILPSILPINQSIGRATLGRVNDRMSDMPRFRSHNNIIIMHACMLSSVGRNDDTRVKRNATANCKKRAPHVGE